MKNIKLITLFILTIIAFAGCNDTASVQPNSNLNIIPQPVETKLLNGTFTLNAATKILLSEEHAEAMKIATDFATKIKGAKQFDLAVEVGKTESVLENEIRFVFSADEEKYGNEGYRLKVEENGITIEAFKPNGMFYAVQTLYQLMPYQIFGSEAIAEVELSLPCVEIFDKPRFGWRGNMIDVSRHFHSLDYLKQNLDNLASLKMNKFHWHLTDDQGWRIEIKAYPKLTEVGAWRVDRNDQGWNDRMEQQPGEKATYGGFYTQEEIKELIQYAADRYIEIIPEIDIPGHSRAAIASYPEISCDEADYKVATGGIMSENTYCPGKEITFAFTEKMLNEVMDLFPSEYMHIGGDECNKDKWKVCNHCQHRIKDNNLKDEHELQSYFIKRVEQIINAKGKKMIGWDEILEGGLAPNATVMSWRGTAGGETAAKAGHDVVMSPNSYCYLDLRQGNLDVEPSYGYGRLLLSTAYSYNPVPKEYSKKVAKHILGVQGNLWSESMQTPFDMNYMLFPRMFAIAEVAWTPNENKDFDDFVRRIEYAFQRLDVMGINYAPSMYNITINHEGSVVSSDLHLKLAAEVHHVDIYYTTDGSEPSTSAKRYTEAFPITESCTIKAQAFKEGKAVGRVTTKTFDIHKAAGKKVEYFIQPNEKYNTSELCLTDCIQGTKEYTKDYWTAFRASDVDFQIDLEQEEELKHVGVSLLHSTGSWIFLPLTVSCEVSQDGKEYTHMGKVDLSEQALQPGSYLKEVTFAIKNQKVRYIRIKAKGMKQNPEWHPIAGGENWIFIDEVVVK